MANYDFDLFTIGAGSGGVRASRVSASYGASVAIAEDGRFGGTCVNVGCIPKKLLSYAAHYREEFEVARAYGWSAGEPVFDWRTLLAGKDREIARLNAVYERLLTNAGVTILRTRATVRGPHEVEADGRTYTARHILVATGSWPQVPEIPGREFAITSNEAFHLERLPASVLVVGGGYIAVEFASIFNGLGVRTTLMYRGAKLLRGFDHDLGERLADEMANKGVAIRLNTNVTALARRGHGTLEARSPTARRSRSTAMFATGRKPNTASASGMRRGTRRRRRGGGGRVFEVFGGFNPRHRRCDQPAQPHPGGDGRGHGAGKNPVRRRTDHDGP